MSYLGHQKLIISSDAQVVTAHAPSDLYILAKGQPKPGGYVDKNETQTSTWSGVVSWGTIHGSATVKWVLGHAHGIWGAVRPDGTVVDYCEISSPYGSASWRFKNEDGRSYTHGTVKITDDGVTFTAVDGLPVYSPGTRPDSLEAALAADPIFIGRLQDDAFAYAANDYLSDRIFRRDTASEGRWSMTPRQIAKMIADMRGLGETYVDFYRFSGPFSAKHTVEFEETLERIGWHVLVPEEYAVDHASALKLLANAEARASGSVEAADRPKIYKLMSARAARRAADPINRMHVAASEGRVDQSEFAAFFDLFDYDGERAGADLPREAHG